DVELSLDDVLESEDGPPVDEGQPTYKNQLLIKGHARPGESIQLLNHGVPIEGAIAIADLLDGVWKFWLDVTEGDYSLTAQAKYGDNEITDPPRTFTVKLDVELSLDDVLESEDGPPVDEGQPT
ncbi:carboxypeptidase regulatory-like domain-containing protein, partial [Pseudomonas sp. PDM28]|nr:carboxypeptidase regulatory-like domain-containing protein [Pseudomonas sp. PDM28]